MTIDFSAGFALIAAFLPAPPAPSGIDDSGFSDVEIFAIATGLLIAIVSLSFATRSLARRFVSGGGSVASVAPAVRGSSPEPRAAVSEPASVIASAQIAAPQAAISESVRAEPTPAIPQAETETAAFEEAAEAPTPSEPPSTTRKFAWTAVQETLPNDAVIGATSTVRELIAHANNGQIARGFELYTEQFFRQFKADSGLSDEEFAQAFVETKPVKPSARTEVAAITEVVMLAPDRLTAKVRYTGGDSPPADERFTFVHSVAANRWLIDDISPAD